MAITINGPYTAYLALVASKRAAGCAETREAAASVAFKEANQATIDGAAASVATPTWPRRAAGCALNAS
jgi:hypothetical protein